MSYQIEFATAAEEKGLRSIFNANNMAVVGDIEDHVVIKDEVGTCGGALLYQTEMSRFHLLTIVVRDDGRRLGLGSKLLQPMLQNPWLYCRDAVGDPQQNYRVTTVSRGSGRGFYQKNGLVDCAFSELVEPFDRQCELCPELLTCESAAMAYHGF